MATKGNTVRAPRAPKVDYSDAHWVITSLTEARKGVPFGAPERPIISQLIRSLTRKQQRAEAYKLRRQDANEGAGI